MNPTPTWHPGASLTALRRRAEVMAAIRAHFAAAGVLEVETPTLSAAALPDPHIESFSTEYRGPEAPAQGRLYLHTSPEFPMKRLLAAGTGPIYQIARVFRQGEYGRRHNPEFTLLEWYRPGWDHWRLMEEVAALLAAALTPYRVLGPVRYTAYAEAFERHAGVDIHRADTAALRRCLEQRGGALPSMPDEEFAVWRDLVLTQLVEPHLGLDGAEFLYDYPADQAALARVRPGDPPLAERFELYLDGVELANGFHELLDPAEQRRRFEVENTARRAAGLAPVPLDENLLAALEAGLPPCSGVALGVDRLVMTALGADRLDEVMAFALPRA